VGWRWQTTGGIVKLLCCGVFGCTSVAVVRRPLSIATLGVAGSAIVLLHSLARRFAMCLAIRFCATLCCAHRAVGLFRLCGTRGGWEKTKDDAAAMVGAKRWPWLVEKMKQENNQPTGKYAYGMPVVAVEAISCCSGRNRSNKSFHCLKKSTGMMGDAGSHWKNEVDIRMAMNVGSFPEKVNN